MRQLNVIVLDDAIEAQELLLAMTRLSTQDKLVLEDAVFVTRTEDGKVRVHETADMTAGEGALSGGFWGLLFGTLLLGPVGGLAVGAASAGTGALVGKLVDAGVSDEFVDGVKDQLAPGQTALILLTAGGDLEALEAEAARFAGARLLYSNLPPEARQAIEEALAAGETRPEVEVTATPPGA